MSTCLRNKSVNKNKNNHRGPKIILSKVTHTSCQVICYVIRKPVTENGFVSFLFLLKLYGYKSIFISISCQNFQQYQGKCICIQEIYLTASSVKNEFTERQNFFLFMNCQHKTNEEITSLSTQHNFTNISKIAKE